MYQEKVNRFDFRSPRSRKTQQPPTPLATTNSPSRHILTAAFLACLFLPVLSFTQTISTDSLSILFLGDRGRHQPSLRAGEFIPVMANRGIAITYTDNLGDINTATLSQYDGLILYADQVKIEPAQENAIFDYVASGKGFIPVHCAISFLESPTYNALVGAQFSYHSTGKFRTHVVNTNHPIVKNFQEFETWDETYVHTKPGQDCTVLLVRREEDRDEPWTWVRLHGKGRVFYTAYGHDDRTWNHPEFQSLMERGIRWACGSNSILDSSTETDGR